MTRISNKLPLVAASLALVFVISQLATAQGRRGGRGFGLTTTVRLAALEQVQTELKLSDEAKASITKVNEDLREERSGLFQGGFSEEAREKLAKLNDAASEKVSKTLDDGQRKRLQEIYIRVNGAAALRDDDVAKTLKITDAQKEKLDAARAESRDAAREAFQGFRDLSQEDRRAKFAEFREKSNSSLLAVLTKEQKEQFEKMKGKKFELDRSQLRGFGGRRPNNN